MSLTRRIFFSLLSLLLISPLANAAPPDRHVLLITIDGFASYLLTDPLAPIPTIRQLAKDGVAGDGMRPSNPSVTWPNHTTLITGVRPAKHSVLFNGVLLRGEPGVPAKIDSAVSRQQLIATKTIFDHLHAAGLRTAGINWPCTRGDDAVHDNFPDVHHNLDHTTQRLRDALVEKGLLQGTDDKFFRGLSAASRDQIWTEAACHVIKTRKPHFMAWHILVTDSLHHKYGPQTPAGYSGLAQADAQVKEMLRALDEAGLRDKTTIFIVADHGFQTANKLIQPNLALKKAGLLKTDLLKIVSAKAHAISEGGTALVYFTDPATKQQDVELAKSALKNMEGIAEILEPNRYAEFGYPDPTKNPQMAELVLSAKPGYAFANSTLGDADTLPVTFNIHSLGYHGFLSTNPMMNTLFVASGTGIKKGTKLPVFDNVDIAPTAAHLLGLKLPDADGKVLTEILSEN